MQTRARSVYCRIIKAFLAIFKGIHTPKKLYIYTIYAYTYTADRHDVKENKKVTYKYMYIVFHWCSAIESNTVRFRTRICARTKLRFIYFARVQSRHSSGIKRIPNINIISLNYDNNYSVKIFVFVAHVVKKLSQSSQQWNLYICLS